MAVEERFQRLSQHRRDHIARVVAVMETLAGAHHMDVAQARLAGWGHDLARELSRADLLAEAERLNLTWGAEEQREPILLHGPVAAEWLRRGHQGTPAVWAAIRFHTTAAPGMDSLGQALFVADGVEPGRQYPEREQLLELAVRDLQAGFCAVLQQTRDYLQARHLAPHPDMLRALDSC